MEFAALPVAKSVLEKFRLDARHRVRANMTGGHITRRMGHSLDFREYEQYSPGDEVRHIDWRASARMVGRRNDIPWDGWLVRRFMAEEHLKIVISLDTRETMFLPHDRTVNVSKIQMARWIAEALTFVAAQSQDHVVWHQLFGNGPQPQVIRGRDTTAQTQALLHQLTSTPETLERFNDAGLDKYLPPASAWIIITDFYFNPEQYDETQRLLHRVRAARNGLRWIVLIDLDSWPFEKHLLGQGSRLITGPHSSGGKRVVVNDKTIATVQNQINDIKQQFIQLARHDYTLWQWEASTAFPVRFAQFFEKRFMQDRVLKRLFMRET